MKKKKGVLILNLGTPDDPNPGAVGRYLREFLGDGRVIDIPWLARKLLVNGIIVPFRKRKSSAEYKKVWTDAGSPRENVIYICKLHYLCLKQTINN